MIPTPDELDVALEAAGKAALSRTSEVDGVRWQWHEQATETKDRYRRLVEPIVVAALEAIPDRGQSARASTLERAGRLTRAAACTCGAGDRPSLYHSHGCTAHGIDDVLGLE